MNIYRSTYIHVCTYVMYVCIYANMCVCVRAFTRVCMLQTYITIYYDRWHYAKTPLYKDITNHDYVVT